MKFNKHIGKVLLPCYARCWFGFGMAETALTKAKTDIQRCKCGWLAYGVHSMDAL